jgi:hypothetical protein
MMKIKGLVKIHLCAVYAVNYLFYSVFCVCPMAELVTASDCYASEKRYRKVVSSSLTGAVPFSGLTNPPPFVNSTTHDNR